MKPDTAAHLETLIDKGRELLRTAKYPPIDLVGTYEGCPRFVDPSQLNVWRLRVLSYVRALNLQPDDYFRSLETALQYEKDESVKSAMDLLSALGEDIGSGLTIVSARSYATPLVRLEQIFDRFHVVAQQLLTRRSNRPTLMITDEYDVQDLLRALLYLDFEDVRAEEWNPSYAGSSTRSDFLLKNEGVVVEVKMTRQGLGNKELGQQLVIDFAHYAKHADCQAVVAFVFDPDGNIQNPRGIEKDLTDPTAKKPTHVFIRPK